jgi:hypothetical protein
VKAGDGPLDEASITAPARAAITPPDNIRNAIVSLQAPGRAPD